MVWAQSMSLPSVTVDAPKQRTRQASKPSAASRNAANPQRSARRTQPAPQSASSATALNAVAPVRAGYIPSNATSGTKTDTPILETPQAINVVTSDQFRAQGAQTVGQALRYTPGVSAETYGASSPFDIYTQIRGFRGDYYLDGLRLPNGGQDGTSSAVVDPYGLQQIEVLKGPSSALYGQSAPGGLVNMVSKRPTDRLLHEIELQGGSFDRFQGAFDLGGPVDKNGRLLYRLTGVANSSGTQVDFVKNERTYIAPAITWRPDGDTSFTVLAHHQEDHGNWPYFNYFPAEGTLLPNPNGRIPSNRYLGEPNYDRLDREQSSAGYLFEHRFDNNVTIRQNLRYDMVDFDTHGVVTGRYPINSDMQTVDRDAIHINNTARSFAVDNQAQFEFATGPLLHKTVLGVDYRHETSDYRFDAGAGPVPPINVYDPVYGQPFTLPDFTITNTNSTLSQLGVYAQDQIKLGRWGLTLSGRHDDADTSVRDRLALTTTPQQDHAFTGRAGLNYVFDSGVAPYVSYSTSFQPANATPPVDAEGQTFKPTTGQQYEAGVKYRPPGSNSLFTAAVFDLTQQDVLTADPNNLGFSVQIGEVRVQGLELEAKTEIWRGFNLIGSYTYLNPRVTKSSDPTQVGLYMAVTPTQQAALWADYQVQSGPLAGFGVGGGVRYRGHTYDITNALKTPDYALFDASVSYDLGQLQTAWLGTRVSLKATDLFDKYYVSACDGASMCTLGFRRTILATLTARW
jgi:iron complex outermembrane recepter protein